MPFEMATLSTKTIVQFYSSPVLSVSLSYVALLIFFRKTINCGFALDAVESNGVLCKTWTRFVYFDHSFTVLWRNLEHGTNSRDKGNDIIQQSFCINV